MPAHEPFRIRPMNPADISSAMALSYSEGWNQTENDWRMLLDNTSNICLVVESGKKVIGTATALNHSDKVAWIGMVLIDKEYRGQGAGRLIFDQILKKLENFESVKLDATPAGYPVYLKSGFRDEMTIYRMTNASCGTVSDVRGNSEPEMIMKKDLQGLIKYDEGIFGVNRAYILESIFNNYPLKSFMIRRNDSFAGYILGRDGVRYNYVGPVLARSDEDAIMLIRKALLSLSSKPAALDILGDKTELAEWLQSIGFTTQRSFVRMYYKSNRYCGIVKNQYLISGPELG